MKKFGKRKGRGKKLFSSLSLMFFLVQLAMGIYLPFCYGDIPPPRINAIQDGTIKYEGIHVIDDDPIHYDPEASLSPSICSPLFTPPDPGVTVFSPQLSLPSNNKKMDSLKDKSTGSTLTGGKEIKLIITGYYQPVPNQRKYVGKDYMSDLRMNGGRKTASGAKPCLGIVAADIKRFPMGSELDIPGVGKVTVRDKLGKKNPNIIDVYMGEGDEGREKCLAFGKQTKKVRVKLAEATNQKAKYAKKRRR